MSKMFPFITKTWNPLGGGCQFKCKYCWARRFANRRKMAKYIQATSYLDWGPMQRKFTDKDFVFVSDMNDLFGPWVDSQIIQSVLDYIAKSPAQFLLLTKNPTRYGDFVLPGNAVAGATIETEFDPSLYGLHISDAPTTMQRIRAMKELKHPRKMVSIEPILDFSPGHFIEELIAIKPEFVAVGFDNYNNNLPEPETLEKVLYLIQELESNKIKVYQKTIREPIDQELAFVKTVAGENTNAKT